MYSAGDADWTTRVCTPRSPAAFCSPTNARWLKPRSSSPPVSVIRPILNDEPWFVVVAAEVVVAAFLVEPQPAAVRARRATTMSRNGIFTVVSEVLDCGTKTVADSTHHSVLAVVLRARTAGLDAVVSSVARRPGESLDEALGRAVDVGTLAHVEQLETRILRDGSLATAYLGLLHADAGGLVAGAPPATADELELVAAARARLRAKLSYTNLGFA